MIHFRLFLLVASILLFNCEFCTARSSNSNAKIKNCSTTFDVKQKEGSRKLNCEDLECEFKILAKPNEAIHLKITNSKRYEETVVIETFDHDENEYSILKGFVHNQQTFFTSAIGGGFHFKFTLNNATNIPCRTKFTPSFSFLRVAKDNFTYCENIVQLIGTESRIIQEEYDVGHRENCPYQLIPEPEFANISSTMYLSVRSGYVLYDDEGDWKEVSGVHIFKNWQYTDLLSTFSHEPYASNWYYQSDKTGEISAFLMPDADCDCGEENLQMPSNGTFLFKTPRYQETTMCPSLECSYTIQIPSANLTDNQVSRVIVSLNYTPQEGSDLTVDGVLIGPTYGDSPIDMEFIVSPVDLELIYITQPMLPQHGRGNYDVNLRRVTLPVECDCSVLKDKTTYTEKAHTLQVVIPETCELMYCEWNIDTMDAKKKLKIEMETDKLSETDEILIRTNSLDEKFNGTQFTFNRFMYLPENDGEAHVTFWRRGLAKETIITLSWQTVLHDTSCKQTRSVRITETYQTFISPNYPQGYYGMSSCEFKFHAEENQIIKIIVHEIDLEQVHDYLSFYDGKMAEKRLMHFTGTHTDKIFESTGSDMVVRFHSDKEWANRGFNFVAFAVNKTKTVSDDKVKGKPTLSDYDTDTETESKIEAMNKNSDYSTPYWPCIVISLVLVIVIVTVIAVALTFCKMKNSERPATSFSNEMVRFNMEDASSSVTIES